MQTSKMNVSFHIDLTLLIFYKSKKICMKWKVINRQMEGQINPIAYIAQYRLLFA